MEGEGKKAKKKNLGTRHGREERGGIRECQGKMGQGWGEWSKEVFTSSIFFVSFLSSSLASEMSMRLMVKF